MSETFSTVVWPALTKTSDTFSRLFETCLNGMVRYFVRRAAISCLREFDDRELRDIGIVRSQIQAAVHGFMTVSANEDVRVSNGRAASWN